MRRRSFTPRDLVRIVLIAAFFAVGPHVTVGQEPIRRLPSRQIAISEDILMAFVDEPCRHFEAARGALVRGENKQAAQALRTASAFLRLESARATADGKIALDASVGELQRLAASVENPPAPTVEALQQAFARAHFALAGHHCIQSAHRCCQPGALENKQELNRAGQDLNAAAMHLKRGVLWAGDEPDAETRKALAAAQSSAEKMIQAGNVPQSEVARAVGSVRDKLQDLTGRRIMLAPPIAGDDKLGPSLLR